MLPEHLHVLQSLLIFVGAIAAAHFMPLQTSYHPNTFATLIFSRIGKRVFRPTAKQNQQKIAGTLGAVLPIFTLVVITIGIGMFAFYPQWLGGLILYLCLDTKITQRTRRIGALLTQKQKATAKHLLEQSVSREVAELSTLGIVKATMDSTVLRVTRDYYLMIFFYLCLGPVVCLLYKLLLLCDKAWRKDIKPDSAFLKPLQAIIYYLEFIPLRAFVLLLSLFLQGKKTFHYFKHYAKLSYQTNSGWILSLFAANLQVQLGGPCKYQGQRFAKVRVGAERHPEVKDIKSLLELLSRIQWFVFSVIALIWLLIRFSTLLISA